MPDTKEIRNQLGISVADFADLIDCNYGQLSMVESGLRPLPPASAAQVAALENAMAQTLLSLPAPETPDEKTVALLHKHVRKCQLTLERLQLESTKTGEQLDKTRKLLHLAKIFETAPFLPDIGVIHTRMNILQRKAIQKLQRYQLKKARLQISIAGLQAEIAAAEK